VSRPVVAQRYGHRRPYGLPRDRLGRRRGPKSTAWHRERTVPSLGLHQVFFEDPSDVTIELNFPVSEAQ
jgi:hypothetical protein